MSGSHSSLVAWLLLASFPCLLWWRPTAVLVVSVGRRRSAAAAGDGVSHDEQPDGFDTLPELLAAAAGAKV